MTTLTGRCHCGDLSIEFQTERAPAEVHPRQCTCSFCRPRRLRWTSDPAGQVRLQLRDGAQLVRYEFETRTAEFVWCRRCGQIALAVSKDAEPRAVINADMLSDVDRLGSTSPVELDGEDPTQRGARRQRTWTPCTIVHAQP